MTAFVQVGMAAQVCNPGPGKAEGHESTASLNYIMGFCPKKKKKKLCQLKRFYVTQVISHETKPPLHVLLAYNWNV